MVEKPSRDHPFISYAGEDVDLAEWLTLKLTSEGYMVWCDRFKLLGGESYPVHIDDAIKNRTFKVIALLSKYSLSKPNPLKERTLALNISKERNEDFLIPLNVDGLNPSELDWMTSDLTFIPFYKSWAEGLRQLLKKLSSIKAPKNLKNGKEIAANTFLQTEFVCEEPEAVYINCLKVLKIPKVIKRFRLNAWITKYALLELSNSWAFYVKNYETFFAFHDPPKDTKDNYLITCDKEYNWEKIDNIEGISTQNIVKNLLKRSINVKFYKGGLDTYKNKLYFPRPLHENDKIHFQGYSGKTTWIQVSGKRIWRTIKNEKEEFLYHLSPSVKIRFDTNEGYLVTLVIGLHLTDIFGEPLKQKQAVARSKKIRKNWWNHEWFNRYLAIASFLADRKDTIIIGENPEEQIIISAHFLKDEAPISVIDKEILEPQEPSEGDIELFEDEDDIEMEWDEENEEGYWEEDGFYDR